MKPINILFTSAGRRVELLRKFRQAYQGLGLTGKIIALDTNPLAPALHTADRAYIVPRLNRPDYVPTLLQICQQEAVDLIFPLIDPDIPLLAHHRKQLEDVGTKAVVLFPDEAATVDDKWKTTKFFQALDLPTPHSWLPNQIDPTQATYPLFIKPRFGSGGKNAFKVHNERELAFFSEYVPKPIIQEWLSGPEITCDVICDLDGRVLGVALRQRIEVRSGEVAKGVTIHDPFIIAACVRIAEALHAVGPITVQCMFKEGVPHFTEINGRFGGGAPLAISAGVDAPRWLLANAADISIPIPAIGSYQSGLYLSRFDDAYILDEVEHTRMIQNVLPIHPNKLYSTQINHNHAYVLNGVDHAHMASSYL
ncbi:MAG: ATP-grasp domain-containing protein [Caldilineaceae bacterium]